jgi:hypothetical protein
VSRPESDLPERLLEADATAFERRMLDAALRKKPSPDASARMARALGVTLTAAAAGTATTGAAVAANAAASKATAAAGGSALWPWVSAGVVGLVVAGAVVGTRVGGDAPKPQAAPPALTAPAPPRPGLPETDVVAEPAPRAVAPTQRSRAATAGDLRDQVAFIDSARSAMLAGSSRRALEILNRYQDKYPAGSFGPEATALKVEVLMKLGREAEARALAERFVAEHRGSLLARRVASVAGLAER